ncbi:MAG: hypothetical protein K0U72_04670 [Gammaproteobacteria bacterium]|nr:hypothetical protein [Gammaproteobacteria bacterium]
MKKISVENAYESGDRLFIKLWYGFSALTLAILVISGSRSIVEYGGVAVLLIFGSVLFYRERWALVDEAFDCDDYLVFRKDHNEFRVPLSNIEGLSRPFANSLHLVTINVARSSQGPKRFTFRAAAESGWFKVPPIYGELQSRISQAKSV